MIFKRVRSKPFGVQLNKAEQVTPNEITLETPMKMVLHGVGHYQVPMMVLA